MIATRTGATTWLTQLASTYSVQIPTCAIVPMLGTVWRQLSFLVSNGIAFRICERICRRLRTTEVTRCSTGIVAVATLELSQVAVFIELSKVTPYAESTPCRIAGTPYGRTSLPR